MDFINTNVGTDGVATLRLSRPDKRNSLSIAVRDEMSDALDELAECKNARVVVISSEGPVFSAGFDLSEFNDPTLQQQVSSSSDRWHECLRSYPLPLIASIQGPALAGGFDLAMMCDLRVASRSATFGRPELSWAPPIYSVVRDLVGGAKARELALIPNSLDAAGAFGFGLITRLVNDNELEGATIDLAAQVALAPRWVLQQTKRTAIAASKPGDEQFLW